MRYKTRRFLSGLSRDELQFIAEFVGSSILEADSCFSSRREATERVADFQRARANGPGSPDQDHKTILLLEFLRRIALQKATVAVRASHA
jgi:hypothetical protein